MTPIKTKTKFIEVLRMINCLDLPTLEEIFEDDAEHFARKYDKKRIKLIFELDNENLGKLLNYVTQKYDIMKLKDDCEKFLDYMVMDTDTLGRALAVTNLGEAKQYIDEFIVYEQLNKNEVNYLALWGEIEKYKKQNDQLNQDEDSGVVLMVEGTETSLEEFVRVNTAEDVCQITDEELADVMALKVGDGIYIGFSEVMRLK
jgi:hypothetical protein